MVSAIAKVEPGLYGEPVGTMRQLLQHPAKRALVSLLFSGLLCGGHCAVAGFMAPQIICMPQADAYLLRIDPMNVLLGSAFLFSALSALYGFKPTSHAQA